jgi:hypothetical protein
MIHPYNNQSQTRWDRGELKIQLNNKGSDRPLGFCDGTDADLAELRAIAESEGAEQVSITKQMLKSGREIWTLSSGD